MKVVVLTTSYPRYEGDAAGSFVASAVAGVRDAGVAVDVVSPASFPHFGIAYGDGVLQNLRRAPWKLALAPPFAGAFLRAARRAARDADLVHAHWLPTAAVALATGKPFVVQLWGSDVELARRAPALARPLLRRARLVVVASSFLGEAARSLGARDVRVVPQGLEAASAVREPANPPHVLFAGRLSPEKGILEFLRATEGLPRVIVGDGPLRARVPESAGFVSTTEMGGYYERAAVVCVPSRREGYGMTAREAMAHGRPVVAPRVGGLAELHGDGVVFVPAGDVAAMRSALERLLADPAERLRRGEAALAMVRTELSTAASASALVEAYRAALTIV